MLHNIFILKSFVMDFIEAMDKLSHKVKEELLATHRRSDSKDHTQCQHFLWKTPPWDKIFNSLEPVEYGNKLSAYDLCYGLKYLLSSTHQRETIFL